MDGPRRITFVTSPARCNLRCGVCRDHSPLATAPLDGAELSLEVVRGVIEGEVGRGLVEVIPSTRGEPLLWPALPALVSWCVERRVLVNVTTNGTFPRLGAAEWARLLAEAASDVKISWNGATAATAEPLMEGLRFEAALDGLRTLLAARDARRALGARACTVSLQVTAREANVGEIPGIVRLAAELGVDRVKVNQLQVHFAAASEEDLRRSPASRARWNVAVREAHAIAERHRASGGTIELANLLEMPSEQAPPAGPCPFLGREAWILQDGCFAPCPAPCGLDGRMGTFGSVRDQPLRAIWEGAAYRRLVDEYTSRPECAACALRRPGGF